MNELERYSQISNQSIEVERRINWSLLMQRRPAKLAALGDNSKFNYLLLPEAVELLNACKHTKDRFMVATLWYTGVRVSEMLAIKRDDIKIESSNYAFIVINSAKKRKKDATRVIEIEDPYYIDLAEVYIKSANIKRNQLLFHNNENALKALNRSTVYRHIEQLSELCDFPIKVSPHTLRHSFGINALLHGIDVKTLQIWLGHADSKTTEIYLQILSGDIGFKMGQVKFR